MAFLARFNSDCPRCSNPIVIGQAITWNRKGERGSRHLDCDNPNAIPADEKTTAVDEEFMTKNAPAVESNGNGNSDDKALDLLANLLGKRLKITAEQVSGTIGEEIRDKIEAELFDFVAEKLAAILPPVQKVEVIQGNGNVVTVEGHKLLAKLIRLIQKRKNLYLFDATGGGKSYAVEQAATALGLRYASESYNSQSPDYLIKGYMDANGKYIPSLFYDFFKNGGVYVGEELDDGSADLLVTLNVALANGHMTFPNLEVVKKHSDFCFVGCGNTAGRGPTPRYPERKSFDAAFANRFVFVRWDYDEALEESIALAINPTAKRFVTWVRQARAAVAELNLRLELTPRTTYILSELSLDDTLTREDLLTAILAGLDDSATEKLLSNVSFPGARS